VKQVDLDIRPQLGLSSAATGRAPLTGPVHALRLHHQSLAFQDKCGAVAESFFCS